MKWLLQIALVVVAVAVIARAATPDEKLVVYSPLKAAPEYHKPVLENEFVLVLDVSIPAGVTVPAHLHPWPAVFITLEPAHLIFRNVAGGIVREVQPTPGPAGKPKVEWRVADTEPASVTNVDTREMRALRVELGW